VGDILGQDGAKAAPGLRHPTKPGERESLEISALDRIST
jgi:hypothetical protein